LDRHLFSKRNIQNFIDFKSLIVRARSFKETTHSDHFGRNTRNNGWLKILKWHNDPQKRPRFEIYKEGNLSTYSTRVSSWEI